MMPEWMCWEDIGAPVYDLEHNELQEVETGMHVLVPTLLGTYAEAVVSEDKKCALTGSCAFLLSYCKRRKLLVCGMQMNLKGIKKLSLEHD